MFMAMLMRLDAGRNQTQQDRQDEMLHCCDPKDRGREGRRTKRAFKTAYGDRLNEDINEGGKDSDGDGPTRE